MFQETWILPIFVVLAILSGSGGCWNSASKPTDIIPAAVREDARVTLTGRLVRGWGGDNFEFVESGQRHFFLIQGVDCPKYGQPFHEQAKRFVMDRFRHQDLEFQVLAYDELKREVGHVYGTDQQGQKFNLAMLLLKKGYAWYDGNEFKDAHLYRQAAEKAKEERIGLWSEENPMPPWEYWQLHQNSGSPQN